MNTDSHGNIISVWPQNDLTASYMQSCQLNFFIFKAIPRKTKTKVTLDETNTYFIPIATPPPLHSPQELTVIFHALPHHSYCCALSQISCISLWNDFMTIILKISSGNEYGRLNLTPTLSWLLPKMLLGWNFKLAFT